MDLERAKALLNDSDAVAAYALFNRAPMQTTPETYRLAVDWLVAVLAVSASEASQS